MNFIRRTDNSASGYNILCVQVSYVYRSATWLKMLLSYQNAIIFKYFRLQFVKEENSFFTSIICIFYLIMYMSYYIKIAKIKETYFFPFIMLNLVRLFDPILMLKLDDN